MRVGIRRVRGNPASEPQAVVRFWSSMSFHRIRYVPRTYSIRPQCLHCLAVSLRVSPAWRWHVTPASSSRTVSSSRTAAKLTSFSSHGGAQCEIHFRQRTPRDAGDVRHVKTRQLTNPIITSLGNKLSYFHACLSGCRFYDTPDNWTSNSKLLKMFQGMRFIIMGNE